jgi:hypothetical protein
VISLLSERRTPHRRQYARKPVDLHCISGEFVRP